MTTRQTSQSSPPGDSNGQESSPGARAFENSSNTILEDTTVNVIGRDQVNYYQTHVGQTGLDILQRNMSSTANHNSGMHGTCADGTRQGLLTKLRDWKEKVTTDEEITERVLWMFGPAGCGKSSIMQTIVEEFEQVGDDIVLASFFFAREHEAGKQNTAECFFATIAYQLAMKVPQLGRQIERAAESDPQFAAQSLKYQFELLIKNPLMSTLEEAPLKIIIFIDALDECIKDQQQAQIIQLIGIAASSPLKVNFLITSRREQRIEDEFEELNQETNLSIQSIDIYNDYATNDDIEVYLRIQFSKIRRRLRLPPSWPAEDIVNALSEQANGMFIYATTILNYISARGFHPPARLNDILENHGSTVFSTLDKIYLQTFETHPNIQNLMRILKVFKHIRSIPSFKHGMYEDVVMVSSILGFEDGECISILKELGSLIYVRDNMINFYHTLLSDFLMDKTRSRQFYLGADAVEVSGWCFQSLIWHNPQYSELVINKFRVILIISNEQSYTRILEGCHSLVFHGGTFKILNDQPYSSTSILNSNDRSNISDGTCVLDIFDGNVDAFSNSSGSVVQNMQLTLECKITAGSSFFRNLHSCVVKDMYMTVQSDNHEENGFDVITINNWSSDQSQAYWCPTHNFMKGASLFPNAFGCSIINVRMSLGCHKDVNLMSNINRCAVEKLEIEGHFDRSASFNDVTGDFEPPQELHIDIFANSSDCAFEDISIKFVDCTEAQDMLLPKIAYISLCQNSSGLSAKNINVTCIGGKGVRVALFTSISASSLKNVIIQLDVAEAMICKNTDTRDVRFTQPFVVHKMVKEGNTYTTDLEPLERKFCAVNTEPENIVYNDETSTNILKLCLRWTRIFDPSSSILWLFGSAEDRRKYVVQNIVANCTTDQFLAAQVIIKQRPNTSESMYNLFPSIACQLVKNIPVLSGTIVPSLKKYVTGLNNGVGSESFNYQFKELILQPVLEAQVSHALRTRIIVIHIADNTEIDSYQKCKEVLSILSKAIIEHALPFSILISCSMMYSEFVRTLKAAHISDCTYMSNSPDINTNMKFYFSAGLSYFDERTKLADYERIVTLFKLPDLCTGDFTYASIVLRFIARRGIYAFLRLGLLNDYVRSPETEDQSRALNLGRLYTAILRSYPRAKEAVKILKVFAYLPSVKFYITRKDVTIPIVEGILGLQTGETQKILKGLSAILYLHDDYQRVGLYDPSFTDYLKDPERSGEYYIGGRDGEVEVSQWCFDSFTNWKDYSKTRRPQKAHLNHLRKVLGASTDNEDWVTNDTRRYRE